MKKKLWTIHYLMLLAVSVGAQTTVTTSGGTVNAVPVFTGSGTLGNSVITQANGNVAIGGSLNLNQGGFSATSSSSAAVGGGSSVGLSTTGDNTNSGYAMIQAFYAGVGYTTPLVLQSQGGNVGIRTENPLGMLDVGGVGGVVVSGANLDTNAGYSLVPLQNSGKMLIGWNRSQGAGEIDLISNRTNGLGGGFNFYDYTNAGVLNLLMAMPGNGNVGIGTTFPGSKLEVNGNLKLTSGSGASMTFADGTTQSTAWTGSLCGGDYAESVNVSGNHKNYEPGDVLVLSDDNESDVSRSSRPYSTLVAGIYSTKPGLVGRRQIGEKTEAEIPMAMVGIVPTKVSAENGSIHKGDLLVSSSTEGYAMKGTDRGRMLGAIVGKAMGSLNSGTGVIEVLVSLQ